MLYNYACMYNHISSTFRTVVHIAEFCVTAPFLIFFFSKSDLLVVRLYINCDLELANGLN